MKITEKVLLKPEDFESSFKGWKVEGVFNPGVIRASDGKIVLYVRVAERGNLENRKLSHCPVIIPAEEYELGSEKIAKGKIIKYGGDILYLKSGECRLTTLSHFKKVILDKTGMKVESIGEKPIFTGLPIESNYGVEDPRITKLGDKYLMTYVCVSSTEGISTALATSENLIKWKRSGIIFRTQNKDVVIFPEKINNKFVALHRPGTLSGFSKPSIWIAYSKDLIYWGRDKSILGPRKNSWDSLKIGPGPPPIKTKKGWLVIYHGVKNIKTENTKKKVYSVGAVLLDLKDPSKVLARSPKEEPLFEPTKKHEKKGFVDNVIFPTGIVRDLGGEYLLIYSGGADKLISVRKVKIRDILNSMEYY